MSSASPPGPSHQLDSRPSSAACRRSRDKSSLSESQLEHDPPSPDLSRSLSARGASRLSSSFFPALAKARLALSSAVSAPAPAPGPRPGDMRHSSAREPPPKPRPILILKLSGASFLDTVIRDDKNKDPLYIFETVRELTNIYRLDHPRDEPVKAATVQWPLHPVRVKNKSGRSIQFGNGSWREAEELLKNGPLGSTAIRKFTIPHYPNSIKWKLIPGNCFCCVTSAVKGPLAVLDAATLSAPPRIKIYHPLIEREVARSQDNYKGIPTILLDYLVVTSLLLVTDVQEWLDRPRETRIPGSSSYTVQRWLALIHDTPAPPEPEHPTVDLSLTVPSTPPHSATFPSPGAYWETQSGITSLSGAGSNGSGSSAYSGEPFTPTTPATPVTSATSANSSAFFSRSMEDAPPVPPMPGSSLGAHSADPMRIRERPKSNPQTSSAPSNGNMEAYPYAQMVDSREDPASLHPRSRSAHALSLPGGDLGASPSAPTSPFPTTSFSSASLSSRPSRRQLPVPPGPVPAHSFAQPWLFGSSSPSGSSSSTSTASTPTPVASPSTPPSARSARAARASMRGLRTIPIPPPPPPPQHSIPLPPKLGRERQGYGGANGSASSNGARPRTAPELDHNGRRRHSESFAGGMFGESSPTDDTGSSVHPYASAASSSMATGTYSVRGRDSAEQELIHQMRGLSASPGPSNFSESRMHARAPSIAAPDYDTHSFVNVPPPPQPPIQPLPVPPSSSSETGSRPAPRRQLTVVNADVTPPPTGDPAAETGGGLRADAPGDLRMNPRLSYAESVYEMPPPAYDAIDFSVRYVPAPPVPPLPPAHAQPPATAHPTPLPVPPADAGGQGQRPTS
ncbi:hypothetical protein C2E23DRAFT_2599 [Lenzites betulinus]|nr:hypothetical protein C2E23DRAFT_2599 [Lenzites betulinus]